MTYQVPDRAGDRKTINQPLAIAIAVVVVLAIVTTIIVLTGRNNPPDPAAGDSSVQATTKPPSTSAEAPGSDTAGSGSGSPTAGGTYSNGYSVSATDGKGEFPGDKKGSPPGWKRMSATGLGLSFDFPDSWDVPTQITIGPDNQVGQASKANAKVLSLFAGVSGGTCGGGSVAFAGFQYLKTVDPVSGLADVLARYGPVAWPDAGPKSGKATAGADGTTKGGAEGFLSSVKVTLSSDNCGTTEAKATGFSLVSTKTGETFVFLAARRSNGDLGADAPSQTELNQMVQSIRQLQE